MKSARTEQAKWISVWYPASMTTPRGPHIWYVAGPLSCEKADPRGINDTIGTSLVVQWLRLHSSIAVSAGLLPGQATKIPHVTWYTTPLQKKNQQKP